MRRALKGTTWTVRRVTPSCLLWNKISRAKNLEHHSPPLTYIQRAPITWQLRSGAAGCQNGDLCVKHERNARIMQTDTLQPVALFPLSDLTYFSKFLYAKKKKRTYSVLLVKTPTRSLNLYSVCTQAYVNSSKKHSLGCLSNFLQRTHAANEEIDLVESPNDHKTNGLDHCCGDTAIIIRPHLIRCFSH